MTTWEPEDEAEWQRKQMTAPHEAPTLDVATDRHIKEDETIETLAEIHPAALVRSLATELLEHRKRLRAIENAKGIPEPLNVLYHDFEKGFRVANKSTSPLHERFVSLQDYNALRLHAQHLQDRLNRMEVAGQMCVNALLHRGVSTDPKHPDRLAVDAMSAALLAEVEKEVQDGK